ncbi:MAG: WG repeat-containing protein, partial [Bacteroidales bacterium]
MNQISKIIVAISSFLFCVAVLHAQDLQPAFILKKSTKIKIWGYEDETGKMVIKPKYEFADVFEDGRAKVWYKKKYGYIDKTGKEIIPIKYDGAKLFSEDLLGVNLKGKWGFIDKTGKEIIPLKYEDVGKFKEGLA